MQTQLPSDSNQDQSSSGSLFGLNLDAQNSYNLRSSANWARVLGVCGILMGGVFLLICIMALSQLNNRPRYRRGSMDAIFGTTGNEDLGIMIFVITAIIFIVGGVFSFTFGNRMMLALNTSDQDRMNRGFAALRNYFALRAITMIVVLLLVLLAFMGQ